MPIKVIVENTEYELSDSVSDYIRGLKITEPNILSIKKESFIKMQEFITHYSALDKQARREFDNPENITYEWCEFPDSNLIELGSDTVNIGFDHLSNLISYKVACLIKGKTSSEIRELFKLEDNVSEELKKRTEWIGESE